MRGQFTATAKIARRANQPVTEMMGPYSVDHHAGRERIVFAGDAAREFKPAAAVFERLSILRRNNRRKLARHRIALHRLIATLEYMRLDGLRKINQHHRPRRRTRMRHRQTIHLYLQGSLIVLVLAIEQRFHIRPLDARRTRFPEDHLPNRLLIRNFRFLRFGKLRQ